MFNNLMILFIAIIFMTVGINAQKTTAADEAAMRAVVEQMMNGWNAKNGEQLAKPFAEDADYVVINGMKIKGRDAIAKGHQGIFDTIYKNTVMTLNVEQIRFLRSDVAVVHVKGELSYKEAESLNRKGFARMTLVMTKTEGKWEIAAFQNTEIQDFSQGGK